MDKDKSFIGNIFHKNGRPLGSMGYFILLMLVFLIGAPEAWMRPNLHQSVFVMMPTLIFLVIPLVFLVASGEIDLSFAATYAVSAYVFAIIVKLGIDPALAIIAGIIGSLFSVVMRMELMHPGDGILGGNYHLYNVLVTGHGLIMILSIFPTTTRS